MEALPFSRKALAFMGIQDTASRWACCWNYFSRSFGIFAMSCIIVVEIYSFVYLDTILITCMALIGIFSLQLASYVFTLIKIDKLFTVLTATVDKMDKTTIAKIRQFDRRQATARVTFILVFIFLFAAYIMVNGLGPETISFLFGFRTKLEADRSLFLIPMVMFAITFLLFNLLMQFYLSLLFLAVQTAKQVQILSAIRL